MRATRRRLCVGVTILMCGGAHAVDGAQSLVRNGSFEGGEAGWTMFGDAVIEKGDAFDGKWRLTARCTGKSGVKPSGATLKGIAVKPHTGYVARCRFRLAKRGAHHTFGIRRSNAGFLACRDGYVRRTDGCTS